MTVTFLLQPPLRGWLFSEEVLRLMARGAGMSGVEATGWIAQEKVLGEVTTYASPDAAAYAAAKPVVEVHLDPEGGGGSSVHYSAASSVRWVSDGGVFRTPTVISVIEDGTVLAGAQPNAREIHVVMVPPGAKIVDADPLAVLDPDNGIAIVWTFVRPQEN